MTDKPEQHHERASGRRWLPLVSLLLLAVFVSAFLLIGFFAGWKIRRSEDLFEEKHQQDIALQAAISAANQAAALTEQHLMKYFRPISSCDKQPPAK
jgi:cell division protein FtsB